MSLILSILRCPGYRFLRHAQQPQKVGMFLPLQWLCQSIRGHFGAFDVFQLETAFLMLFNDQLVPNIDRSGTRYVQRVHHGGIRILAVRKDDECRRLWYATFLKNLRNPLQGIRSWSEVREFRFSGAEGNEGLFPRFPKDWATSDKYDVASGGMSSQ